MRKLGLEKSKLRLAGVLVAALALAAFFSGCAELGFPPLETSPATGQPGPTTTTAPSAPKTVTTADTATLTVYQHLLEMAASAEAKDYLADYCTSADNWTARTELFKDGSSLWYVTAKSAVVKTGSPAYWREAGWFILQDGSVIPSSRLEANALRVEADLQKLSPVATGKE